MTTKQYPKEIEKLLSRYENSYKQISVNSVKYDFYLEKSRVSYLCWGLIVLGHVDDAYSIAKKTYGKYKAYNRDNPEEMPLWQTDFETIRMLLIYLARLTCKSKLYDCLIYETIEAGRMSKFTKNIFGYIFAVRKCAKILYKKPEWLDGDPHDNIDWKFALHGLIDTMLPYYEMYAFENKGTLQKLLNAEAVKLFDRLLEAFAMGLSYDDGHKRWYYMV